MNDVHALAQAAGLPVERLRVIHDHPHTGAHLGLVAPSSLFVFPPLPEEDELETLVNEGVAIPVPRAPELLIFADPRRPAHLLVAAPGGVAILEGDARVDPVDHAIRCALDATASPVSLRLDLPARTLLLRATADRLMIVEDAPPQLVDAEIHEPDLSPPALDTTDLSLAEPIAQHVEALSHSIDPLERLAAAGLMLRLGRTVRGIADPRAAAQARVDRVRSWTDALPRELLSLADDAGAQRALELGDELRGLVDTPDDVERAAALVLARDDLESLHVTLSLARAAQRLSIALAAADDDGEATLTTLAALTDRWPPHLRERLASVGWAEPHQWWALLMDRSG